ncbi:MAG: T9SS type A sorting domain-containing protein [Ignavibacteriales bacterium]|nr:MAG: T9SS type A sorting domain-containing protein [Ignavibacteriaceae bacterium]MBW7873169.1 T9SS type A sorting domain-containing protein [Ignavibacteria bacterium]MCZ2142811.1 T9SS type A sorting domain-containing protein [Ignavibacteriales bacterium]MBV6443904.1 hypothetical protein [Ignavibacteriaceae bacterium]MBZ0196252.1 T9SS type A sorting domain-containing protein [Ignavibacteriaceae bacterium]
MKSKFYGLFIALFVVFMVQTTFSQFKDPKAREAYASAGPITVDGNLNEPAWGAVQEYLVFGPNAPTTAQVQGITGGVHVTNSVPYVDTTYTYMKFLKVGMKLYIGFYSDDKYVCRFGDSWEGDGLFMKIKNAAGDDKEYKLYFNAGGPNPDIVYEAQAPGMGAGMKGSNTVVNDTTQIDNGYSAELLIYLDSLGYGPDVTSVPVAINIFDPDMYHVGMIPWGAPGTYYKTWWGSEWGGTYRNLVFYQDPPSLDVYQSANPITVDGFLNESDWSYPMPYLMFGPQPQLSGLAKSVTSDVLVKGPYTDTTVTPVKFLRVGNKLYIGFQSNDKQVCRFGDSWEGDGMFLKIKNAAGVDKEFKLYFNAGGVDPNMVYESTDPNTGAGAGIKKPGTVVNDTTQVDNGYSAELMIDLGALGFTTVPDSVQVCINIFDPDNFHNGMPAWGPLGTFHKTFWGSEWGSQFRTLYLTSQTTPVELTSFTARAINNSVELNWTTASERNNSGFQIERSTDGISFASVGFINGRGTTTETTNYSYTDNGVNGKLFYRLKQIDYNGDYGYSDVIEVSSIVEDFALEQNYPNPFNPTTTISFAVPSKSFVIVKVYNALGKEVRTLANGEYEAGRHTLDFNAADLASGVYYYTISAGNFTATKKMILMK